MRLDWTTEETQEKEKSVKFAANQLDVASGNKPLIKSPSFLLRHSVALKGKGGPRRHLAG